MFIDWINDHSFSLTSFNMEVSVGTENLTFYNVTMINYDNQPLPMRVECVILILIILAMNGGVIRLKLERKRKSLK